MICGKCGDFKDCQCPIEDIEAKLDRVPNFAYRKCLACGKHYARCRCDNPDFFIKFGGE